MIDNRRERETLILSLDVSLGLLSVTELDEKVLIQTLGHIRAEVQRFWCSGKKRFIRESGGTRNRKLYCHAKQLLLVMETTEARPWAEKLWLNLIHGHFIIIDIPIL